MTKKNGGLPSRCMGFAFSFALALGMCPAAGIAEEVLSADPAREEDAALIEQVEDDGEAISEVSGNSGAGELVVLDEGNEALVAEQVEGGELELQTQAAAVPYSAWNGTKVADVSGGCTDYVTVDGSTTSFEDGKFYVVASNVTVDGRITVSGTAHLILCDGAKLTAKAGITTTGATLNIYGQSDGTGALEVTDPSYESAGIGGGQKQAAGELFVHGGAIKAVGYYGSAGIGGGRSGGGDGGPVTIYGGTVEATGGTCAAGIGGAQYHSGKTVTIYGGTVTASSPQNGAGIGGGEGGAGGPVKVYGGRVTATSGGRGAGIGGGDGGSGAQVTITGGTVIATGGEWASGIGGGSNGAGGDVTIEGGCIKAFGGKYSSAGIGKGVNGNSDGNLTLSAGLPLQVSNDSSTWTPYDGSTRAQYMKMHGHDFAYTADGATITAQCQNEECDVTDGLTLTISAPTNLTYDGTAKAATLSTGYNTVAFPGSYSIKYLKGGTEVAAANVKDAGTYTASVTVGDATASVNFTIAEVPSSVKAAPTALALTYTGKAQALVTAGTAVNGTMEYSLDNKTFSPAIPTATDAGTYTVWYMVVGGANYSDVAAQSLKVTVAKAASSIKLAAQTKTYTGKAIAYKGKITTTGSSGEVTLAYYTDAACTKGVAVSKVKNAGTYYVKAKLAADANHKAATSKAAKLTITKAAQPMKVAAVKRTAKASATKKKAVTVAAPLKFTKKAQGTVTYAKVAKGSDKCLTVNKKTGKVTIKRGTKKGTYKVKIKVTAKGNKNYKAGSKTIICKVVVK